MFLLKKLDVVMMNNLHVGVKVSTDVKQIQKYSIMLCSVMKHARKYESTQEIRRNCGVSVCVSIRAHFHFHKTTES